MVLKQSRQSKQNITPPSKGLIQLPTKNTTDTEVLMLCTRCASALTAGGNSQGTRIEMNRVRVERLSNTGWGKGSRTLQPWTGIRDEHADTHFLPFEIPASKRYAARMCTCTCVHVCVSVAVWWAGMWGNKSALSTWSGTKWLRKQAELWFYSLMFVTNIYNQGFREI